jgi:hypothetical protein
MAPRWHDRAIARVLRTRVNVLAVLYLGHDIDVHAADARARPRYDPSARPNRQPASIFPHLTQLLPRSTTRAHASSSSTSASGILPAHDIALPRPNSACRSPPVSARSFQLTTRQRLPLSHTAHRCAVRTGHLPRIIERQPNRQPSLHTARAMADDAELAFLSAQQEYDPAANFAAADEEDYDPATAYTPPPAADGEGEDESEYLPEPAPVSAEVSAAPTPSKQLRTRGGFVDESEDEEEEPVEQPKMAAAGLLRVSEIAESPQRSFTSTPTNSVTSPVVHLHSAQDQGAPSLLSASVAVNESAPSIASTVLNGGTPVPDDTKPGAPDAANAVPEPQPAAPVSSVPASAAALPKTRLPQDRIGILEDRIAEDPRGDIDAWISLIDEHRRRHKHDDARAVFDRFLTTFPTAVSCTGQVSLEIANVSRASNGLSTSRSRPSLMSCQRWSSCSARLCRWLHMFSCTLLTSTSLDGATT